MSEGFVYMYGCIPRVRLLPREVRRRYQILCSCSYKQLCAAVWVLGTEPKSSARAASALNHWDLSRQTTDVSEWSNKKHKSGKETMNEQSEERVWMLTLLWNLSCSRHGPGKWWPQRRAPLGETGKGWFLYHENTGFEASSYCNGRKIYLI